MSPLNLTQSKRLFRPPLSVLQWQGAAQTGLPGRRHPGDQRAPAERVGPLPLRGGGRAGGPELWGGCGAARWVPPGRSLGFHTTELEPL